MIRLALAVLLLGTGLAAAQTAPETAVQRPPAKPQQAGATDAPAERPPEAPRDPAPAEPPAPPPVAPEPAPADVPAEPPARTPPASPTAAAPVPAEPKGPPIRRTLRESDFDYAACLLALHDLGTEYEEMRPIREADQRDCGISRPIRVSAILPGVTLEGGALMRCDTARSLGFWLRDFVRPAAGRLPDSPRLTGLQLGTTYDCRGRVGDGSDPKLSEHAFGNAIDIAAFSFQGSEPIPVQPREDSGDLIEAFQRSVRGAACLYFTTVLGPGSNAAHDDHLHLDIAGRNGGWRLCQ